MKVLFLFNRIRSTKSFEDAIRARRDHDSQFYGMFRLRKFGLESNFLEVEQVFPLNLARLSRRVLGTYFVHAMLLPKMSRYDVVFSSGAFGTLLIRAVLGVRRPKWVLLDFNLSATLQNERTFRQKLLGYAVSRVDGVVTISAAERDIILRRFPALSDRVIFLHEATDPHFFAPRPEVAEEDFILSVGFDPGRDYRLLIEAIVPLGVPLIIAAQPETLGHLLPLPACVTVRSFSSTELRDLYAKARLVVVPLRPQGPADSMGTFAALEAMSMSKAVIATDNLSVRSYIEPGVTGFLVPPHDAPALRRMIETLCSDDGLRRKVGRSAREFVVDRCDADAFAGKLAAFLKRVDGTNVESDVETSDSSRSVGS